MSMNRHQRRAQARRRTNDDDFRHEMCVCCNARKVMQHGVEHARAIRDRDGAPVIFPVGGDECGENATAAVAEFGVLRVEVNLITARFDIFEMGEPVCWFTPDDADIPNGAPAWAYTLMSIRRQLEARFGPAPIDQVRH